MSSWPPELQLLVQSFSLRRNTRDWTQIYPYIAARVMARRKKTEIPEDIRVGSLDEYQVQSLKGLKDWTYQRRIRARRERRRAEKAPAMAETEARAPDQLRLGV